MPYLGIYFITEKLGVRVTSETQQNKFIHFVEGQTTFSNGGQQELEEAYELRIDANKDQIKITASTGHGIFNGIQSLLNLDNPTSGSGNRTFPSLHVKDRPRFTYRGYMLDVSRNFYKKETIFKLLDMMAMYKLNKFHFHLTDDDGWRIEIPDIPELTQVSLTYLKLDGG
jgi:hexosaminidase